MYYFDFDFETRLIENIGPAAGEIFLISPKILTKYAQKFLRIMSQDRYKSFLIMLDLKSVHFSFLAVSYFFAKNRSEFLKSAVSYKKKGVCNQMQYFNYLIIQENNLKYLKSKEHKNLEIVKLKI